MNKTKQNKQKTQFDYCLVKPIVADYLINLKF